MKNVFIVSGAPGSGKTTYVKNHKKAGDLVIDLDYICAALQLETNAHANHDSVWRMAVCARDSLYPFIANRFGDWNDCWIVTAEARQDKLKELARMVRATDTIEINTTLAENLKQIERDKSRTLNADDFKMMAKRWHETHKRPPSSYLCSSPEDRWEEYKKTGHSHIGGAYHRYLSGVEQN